MALNLVPWRKRHDLARRSEDGDPFTALQREMNRMFEEFHRGLGLAPLGRETWGGFTPLVNVTENDKEVCVTAELPGMEEKDIEISVSRNALSIKGEKAEEHETKERNYYRMERSFGSFEREVALPVEIDADKAEAVFKKGVLCITLPKTKEAQRPVHHVKINKG
jgi:HSP20 family protein